MARCVAHRSKKGRKYCTKTVRGAHRVFCKCPSRKGKGKRK